MSFLNIIPKIILENLMSYIYKVKKIDENGAQQLLTDIGELKNNILNLYFIVIKQDPGQSKENDSRYICLNMIIKKEFSKIESRLKCLGSHKIILVQEEGVINMFVDFNTLYSIPIW